MGQHYLAAVHLVESKFGRVKSDSVAGAKGPMQFLPSTWDIYGRGGDIHDPHDAILAAANLLDDAGAPADYRRALYAYNPSNLYVDAVQRYARLIKRDAYAVYFLYCWGPLTASEAALARGHDAAPSPCSSSTVSGVAMARFQADC